MASAEMAWATSFSMMAPRQENPASEYSRPPSPSRAQRGTGKKSNFWEEGWGEVGDIFIFSFCALSQDSLLCDVLGWWGGGCFGYRIVVVKLLCSSLQKMA